MNIRETLEQAWDEAGGGDDAGDMGGAPGEPGDATGGEGDGAADAAGARDAGATPRDGDAGTEGAADVGTEGRARDASGRFAPKPKEAVARPAKAPAKEAVAAQAPAGGGRVPNAAGAQLPGAAAATALKPPQSWRPEVREKWAGIPPEAQAEIDRREREVSRVLQEQAQARQFQQSWHQTLAPYEAMLRQHGADPLSAVGAALQSMHSLYSGPPQVRAKALAALIDSSGVPLELINAHWSGEQPQGQPQGQHLDPDALIQRAKQEVLAEFQQQRQQATQQSVAQEIAAFAQGAEFFEDVKPMVGAIMRANPDTDLKAAYEQACWASPNIRAILQQRDAAAKATERQAATQSKRAAASSVRSETAGAVSQKPRTVRETLEAAWSAAEGR